jgi:hypothetical protein
VSAGVVGSFNDMGVMGVVGMTAGGIQGSHFYHGKVEVLHAYKLLERKGSTFDIIYSTKLIAKKPIYFAKCMLVYFQ